MASPEETALCQEAAASLQRMQEFEVGSLPREAELGRTLNFAEALPAAKRLIELYQRLSLAALDDFPAPQLTHVRNLANQDFNLLDQILKFNTDQSSPAQVRQSYIQAIINTYAPTFATLHPLIAYSLHRSADFQRLDREARGTLQAVKDRADGLTGELSGQLKKANSIVEEVRKVAAETGVSQQAIYFKDEAQEHLTEAETWRERTVKLAWLLGLYAVASLFIAKIPWLKPDDTYQSIQLGVSKLLIFAVISFMLYLSARNFLSHKHNSIVNKHRQNALMTYKALADAAGSPENREVVLTHAAACIFSPQATGYSHDAGADIAKATSVVEVLGKPFRSDK
jgi:hypothetical protein